MEAFNVRFVNDTDLPVDHDWVIGMTHRGERLLFVKQSAVSPEAIAQAWEGGQLLSVAPAARRHDRPDLRVAI